MPTSRPLVEGDRVIAICLPLTIGDSYLYDSRWIRPEYVALCSDFSLSNRSVNNWWEVVGARVFGIDNCVTVDPCFRVAALPQLSMSARETWLSPGLPIKLFSSNVGCAYWPSVTELS